MCEFLRQKGFVVACSSGADSLTDENQTIIREDAIVIRLDGWGKQTTVRPEFSRIEQCCERRRDSVPILLWCEHLSIPEKKILSRLGIHEICLGNNYLELLRLLERTQFYPGN